MAENPAPAPASPAATDSAWTRWAPEWLQRVGGCRPWLRLPLLGLGVVVLLLALALSWLWSTTELPPAHAIGESAVLLDRNGEELAVLAQEGLRLEVPLEDMAPVAVDALIAAEDQRFYDHTGVDPVGIGRALWNNLRDDSLQGGSTITQQLVKNAYLNADRTITRKAREALLIGMLRSPEQLDPANDLDAATRRGDAVLRAMVDTDALSMREAEAAIATPVQVVQQEASPTTLRAGVAPHFVEHVRGQLVDRFGEQALYDEGLVVRTTLDLADQRAAESAVAEHLDDPGDPQAALVAIDRTGAVRAWVGGRDFEALQVDLVAGAGGSDEPARSAQLRMPVTAIAGEVRTPSVVRRPGWRNWQTQRA